MTNATLPTNARRRPPALKPPPQTMGHIWLIYSGLQDNDLDNLRAQGGQRVRDAVVVRESDGQVRYAFRYASVYVVQKAYRSPAGAVQWIQQFEAADMSIAGQPVLHRTIGLLPAGGPERSEVVARIMMAEADDGIIGKTEQEAVYANYLDFGEHSVAVSPAGLIIAGRVEETQVQTYLYYVAQIAAAICRYSQNEARLSDVMENIKAKAKLLDLESLQQINVSTSKAMLDISDELLNIPPREGFILRTLMKTANIDVYEERIARMLEIIQHHVEYRHHQEQERNSKRIEFVLFIIAVLGALAGLADIFGTANDTNEISFRGGTLVLLSVIITVVASMWFRKITARRV
ncbi:MAG: hypothetical protein KTR25_02900 [Myxococcales bacterium]|nr:hypothetical protein [Myxococcales bacterium]